MEEKKMGVLLLLREKMELEIQDQYKFTGVERIAHLIMQS